MIWIDNRAGSNDLAKYLSPYGLEVELCRLPSADIAWYGKGQRDGEPCDVRVGYELKTISDLVASMRDNRLSGQQLPAMLEDYDHVGLIVQGVWRCGEDGLIQVMSYRGGWMTLNLGRRGILYKELAHYLSTLTHRLNVTVDRTSDYMQTAAYVACEYSWWNDKDWQEHDSFNAIYAPVESRIGNKRLKVAGNVECIAAQLPGIGRKAWEFRKWFKTPVEIANANVKDLMRVDGVGKTGAEKIYRWWRSE